MSTRDYLKVNTTSLESIGRAICSRRAYTFTKSVGTGAFKETFEVVKSDGGRVALKVCQSNASRVRAAREIAAMIQCNHPNIAKVDLVDEIAVQDNKYVYMVEEFLAGGTLATHVARNGNLSPEATHRIGLPLVDAVAHIAAKGLVHRDLKPENVMLRAGPDSPVIVDFGLVRNLGEPSLTQSWLPQGPGTPYYAPPEQLRNEKALIDWRADQFSLGVTLSIVAFGIHPYGSYADEPGGVVGAVSERLQLPKSFVTIVDATDLSMLARMVQPWPAQRYRTPIDLATAWRQRR